MQDPSCKVLQSPPFPRATSGVHLCCSQRSSGHPAGTSSIPEIPCHTSGGCSQGQAGSAAQPKAAVQSQSQSRALAQFPNPPSLELGWVTWPYFQSLQKNLHTKLLDGSSLPHLNCFHFFINQLVKET